jgi:hypothetical protein
MSVRLIIPATRVANSTDVEFTVAKPQAAIAHKAGDDE